MGGDFVRECDDIVEDLLSAYTNPGMSFCDAPQKKLTELPSHCSIFCGVLRRRVGEKPLGDKGRFPEESIPNDCPRASSNCNNELDHRG